MVHRRCLREDSSIKVVEGAFGKAKEGDTPVPLKDIIDMVLEDTELGEQTSGSFVLLLDTDDRLTFATNEDSKPELVYMLESAKLIIMKGAINE